MPLLLARSAPSDRECVGGDQFEKVEGDHFTILGLPMFPLLAEFRRMGVMAA